MRAGSSFSTEAVQRLLRAYSAAPGHLPQPSEGQIERKQGLFLATNDQAHRGYRAERLAYIRIRLAMFADGIGDLSKAATWTLRAIESARQIPAAWDVMRMQSWHAMPPALLSDDFFQVAQLVAIMTALDVINIVAKAKSVGGCRVSGLTHT